MFKFAKNLRLSNKLIFGFLLPTMIFISFVGYFSYVISKNKLETQVLASLSLLTKTKSDYLMAFMDFNKGRVADWSSDGYIRDGFDKVVESKNDATMVNELAEYIKTGKQILDPEVVMTDIIDLDGVIVVSTVPDRIGIKETLRDFDEEYNFTKARNASFGQAFVSSVVTEDEPGHMKDIPMWHVSTPLFSLKAGKLIGVMVNHISNAELSSVLVGDYSAVANDENLQDPSFILQEDTLDVYLVDSRKLMLTPSKFIEGAILHQVVDTDPVKSCQEMNKGMNGIYEDYRGVRVFGVSNCIEGDSRWILISEVDEPAILMGLNDIKVIIVILTLIALFGALILTYFLNKSIVYPVRALSGLINKIAEGQLLQNIEVVSKDEIGTLEKAFNEMSKRIEEEDRAKSEFVSLASHQLLTPLTTVRWFMEILMEDNGKNLTDQQKEHLRDIDRVNNNMIDLVKALLDVSRIELGTFSVIPEESNLIDIVNGVLMELSPIVDRKKLKIMRDYSGEVLPIIMGDPKLLRIIFQNLLTNAVKYTPNQGVITIGISIDKEGVSVKIADSGYGISISDYPKIFSKFYRGENVRQREPDGTGLGLYIVKSIIDHSGGKIWFESEEGKGTTFHVTYPPEGMTKKIGEKVLI